MNLRIITDSTSDFTLEQAKDLNIDMIPITININNKSYRDGIDISKEEFYEVLVEGKYYPKTSQPALGEFLERFEDAKKKHETVLVIVIAKTLSGSVNTAQMAKDMAEYDDIHIVESCTTIAGLQILVNEAIRLNKEGKSIEEIVAHLDELKLRIVVVAVMNTLENLYKGGRLSRLTATVGRIINIKPLLNFRKDGSIAIPSKSLGNTRANKSIANFVLERPRDPNYPCYFYYSHSLENLNNMKNMFVKMGIPTEGPIVHLSPAVGCHIGANAYGVVYIQAKESIK